MTEKLANSLIYGIWKNDVRQGLLWSLRPTDVAVRITNLLVPSWSWAKTHGRLGCISLSPDFNLCPSSPIIDSSQMRQGIIVIDTLCGFDIVEDESYLLFGGNFRVQLYFDNAVGLGAKIHRDETSTDENAHIRQEIFCIHVGTWLSGESGSGTLYGLAVAAAENVNNHIYKRIGMFSTTRLNLSDFTSTW